VSYAIIRSALLALSLTSLSAVAATDNKNAESYESVPMPPGFQVVISELEGPVFADAKGHTLYQWPVKPLRNGAVGERKGQPSCDQMKYTVNAGLMSPYPPGLELPEVETRPSCLDVWPAVVADKDAKPVGKWKIIERKDGIRQWSYDGYALYTSVLDEQPGDVNGGTLRKTGGDGPGTRKPVGPPPMIPPQFEIVPLLSGRMLVTSEGNSVYAFEKDSPGKSNCYGPCAYAWKPIPAPAYAKDRGEFTILEREPGIRQWAFRQQPLYTRVADESFHSMRGSDEPGWSNVYTQRAPEPPSDFTVQDTYSGIVLADNRGKTVYVYNCGDDALDQLACDHPGSTQAYRLTVCGGGDPKRCLDSFPYVLASENAKSSSRLWSVMWIDPMTGKLAKPEQTGALRVWAFRNRPVYTNFRDRGPGELHGDSWGEFYGYRNGYKAFWLRDDYDNNAE
jgi:predicted lipoprotein with Yx(FWY)xxD motif